VFGISAGPSIDGECPRVFDYISFFAHSSFENIDSAPPILTSSLPSWSKVRGRSPPRLNPSSFSFFGKGIKKPVLCLFRSRCSAFDLDRRN
jgi:hypothetical protein